MAELLRAETAFIRYPSLRIFAGTNVSYLPERPAARPWDTYELTGKRAKIDPKQILRLSARGPAGGASGLILFKCFFLSAAISKSLFHPCRARNTRCPRLDASQAYSVLHGGWGGARFPLGTCDRLHCWPLGLVGVPLWVKDRGSTSSSLLASCWRQHGFFFLFFASSDLQPRNSYGPGAGRVASARL
jgi:hypothetical protein